MGIEGVIRQGLPDNPIVGLIIPMINGALENDGAVVIEVVLVVTVATVPANMV